MSVFKNGMVGSFMLSSLLAVAVCQGSQEKDGARYADFRPVSVSIGCQADTPTPRRLNVERASDNGHAILPLECIDREKSISGIYPEKIGVVHRKSIDVWNFVLILNKKDALNVDALSRNNVGGAILVSVAGKVVAKAILNAPIVGQRIYISVDSESDGDAMAEHFMVAPSAPHAERKKS
jgi:hypothetical protein